MLRYDKRGVGQSGGRSETVTLQDYADDLIAVVKWLAKRDDVDPRRIAVVGHSEGGTIAMLAAAREKKIGSLVLMATSGTTGADLILEQQQRELDRLKLPEAEKAPESRRCRSRFRPPSIERHRAGRRCREDVRKQADTPWFRSLLLFDPATVMPKRQAADPHRPGRSRHAGAAAPRRASWASSRGRARRAPDRSRSCTCPGVNHLLVPATTGDVAGVPAARDRSDQPGGRARRSPRG